MSGRGTAPEDEVVAFSKAVAAPETVTIHHLDDAYLESLIRVVPTFNGNSFFRSGTAVSSLAVIDCLGGAYPDYQAVGMAGPVAIVARSISAPRSLRISYLKRGVCP